MNQRNGSHCFIQERSIQLDKKFMVIYCDLFMFIMRVEKHKLIFV